MSQPLEAGSTRRAAILDAAILVFGRFGFKKTSVDDLAGAAKISKQGLYLHFSSKEEVFLAAIQKYLDDGLCMVQLELARTDRSLCNRLMKAMDAWFGRHFDTFSPESLDVIKTGNLLAENHTEEYKSTFRQKIAKAIAESPEFDKSKNVCTPKDIAEVLFIFGLTWKEGHTSRADFMKKVGICIRACCQIEK
jgi:AcrR family transcriptional regulator